MDTITPTMSFCNAYICITWGIICFQARLSRALKPYGDCEYISTERNKLLIIWSRYGYNYSMSACKFSQKQLHIIKDCDCYYYEMPAPLYLENTSKPCVRFSGCLFRVQAEFALTSSFSDVCPYPCEETLFETTVSSHRWPSAASIKRVIRSYAPRKNMTLQSVRESLAKVSIYYDSSRVKTIAETPLYSNIFTLLGEIGGHLGLWIGVSLLAVCELFEIGYDLISLIVCRK